MSRLFEIFGYPITDNSEEAQRCRSSAWCPFMDGECDGGGNRNLSHIDLSKNTALKSYFLGREIIPSGVCSLQLRKGEQPWIICPRRLLVLIGNRERQKPFVESLLLQKSGYTKGQTIGVWPEMRVKHNQQTKAFDYTFDYIIMPLERVRYDEIEEITHQKWKKLEPVIKKAGYSVTCIDGCHYVEEFPIGSPCIVEVMTSSTAGGNQRKRSTIPMAFEDAILGKPHQGPSINYRQVWARMVSQLIVKSEVGMAWGGKSFWVIQDTLANYISSTTALDFKIFLAEQTSEVNVLCFSYRDSDDKNLAGIVEIGDGCLYAGLISPSSNNQSESPPSFQDMIRAPVCPPKSILIGLLAKRFPTNKITVKY